VIDNCKKNWQFCGSTCASQNSSSSVTFFASLDDLNCSQLAGYSERDYMIDDFGVLVRIEKPSLMNLLRRIALYGPFDG
jgi:hypothetical protein